MSDFEVALKIAVNQILNQAWSTRNGQVVPEAADVALNGGAVKLDATMLYADLARSTDLVIRFDKRIVAKIIKSFLTCCAKIIRKEGGYIRSFDGDRIMAVFIGGSKNSNAVKAALKINYAVQNVVKVKIEAKYPTIKAGFKIEHCVGIDTGEMIVVRSGIINNNDLVWVGFAANMAAKLSDIRTSAYYTYITDTVLNKLSDETRYSNGKSMWLKYSDSLYKSSYWWSL